MRIIITAVVLVAASQPAFSDMYKCEDPVGKTIYSQTPCSENAERIDQKVSDDDAMTPQQRQRK
ncbi:MULTISPECIES: DUF4124 domain-containing protein [Thiorhodovibrio]|uniref:DUF4124 domain-containing protein n=1 Tax=Thiorhodovibrio TaxID=61593 RepID=UPI0019120E2F|nr:hypothetical protein [Thiorhodovibrio winogradskyi]